MQKWTWPSQFSRTERAVFTFAHIYNVIWSISTGTDVGRARLYIANPPPYKQMYTKVKGCYNISKRIQMWKVVKIIWRSRKLRETELRDTPGPVHRKPRLSAAMRGMILEIVVGLTRSTPVGSADSRRVARTWVAVPNRTMLSTIHFFACRTSFTKLIQKSCSNLGSSAKSYNVVHYTLLCMQDELH